MESAQETIDELVSVSQRLINALAVHLGREGGEAVEISRIQLAGDLHKIVATSLTIVETLKKSLDYRDRTLDERLNDWLMSQEPATCKNVLNSMAKLVGVDENKSIWKWFPMLPFAPSQDRVKEAITLFTERRSHFHFLLTTDVWNHEKHAQRRLGANAQVDSIDLVTSKTTIIARLNVLDKVPMNIDTMTHEVAGKTSQKKEVDWKQLEDILKWLDGLDCTEKHEVTLDLRQDDTCTWLPDTHTYKAWRRGDHSFLWLHGKPGAGKSVLTASVIEGLEHSLEDVEFLAFFYCDFRSERATDAAEVMRSLLSQLMNRFLDGKVDPGDVLHDLLKERGRSGSLLKNAKRLARLVSSAANQFTRQPLIVIDALDECKDIQNLLDALVVLSQSRLRLFATSRPLQLIKDRFADFPSLSLENMSTVVSADIRLHVTRELDSDRRLRIAAGRLKEEIRSNLCENADGMFRWIQCQLETLKRCMTPLDIRGALENLPKGLEETYNQILLAIDKQEREAKVARRALTWLIAAFCPLRLSQIVEALSIDLDRRILDPDLAPIHGPALLDALSSLVTHDEETDIVILSHFSVQEYLTGELAHAKLSAYRIDPQYAEGQLAEFCMCYIAACLNQGQGFGGHVFLTHIAHGSRIDHMEPELSGTLGHHAATSPPPESHPLLEYVLSHTFDHLAHVDSGNKVVLRALVALKADVQRNPLAWDQICTERRSSGPAWPTSRDDFVLYILIAFASEPLLRSFLGHSQVKPKAGTNPLIYAAQLGKVAQARILLSRGASLNRSGLLARRPQQVTPLEAAVHYGSSSVANIFLMKGGPVPWKVFVDVFKAEYRKDSTGARLVARLLQTDDFAEWAVEIQDGFLFLDFLGDWDYTHYVAEQRPDDEDIVTILRRLMQVRWELLTHDLTWRKLFRRAATVGHISTLRYLLSLGIPPPPDILLDVSRSAKASITTMRLLIDYGVDLHAVTADEETALHVTINLNISEEQCLEGVRLLVNAGCDPSAYSLHDKTPLHCAARCGYISVVQYLLSRSTHRPHDILLACSTMHPLKNASIVPVINYLVRVGADVHVVAANGDTMLHAVLDHASCDHEGTDSEGCLETAKILIQAGCSPSLANAVGDTPLDVALQTGHVSVVDYFLTLNLPLPHDALLRASSIVVKSSNSLKMIKMLLEKGIDLGVVSANGNNALHLAVSTYLQEYVELTVKMLVEARCDPCERNTAGQTPFHLAAMHDHKSTITYLIERGVPLPHDILLFATREELYTYLIERGADTRAVAKNGDTVLHGVVDRVFPESDALKLTKALIRTGCNPSMFNSAGETPLQIAVRKGYVSIVEYLFSLNVPLPSDLLLAALHPRSRPQSNFRLQTIRFLIEKGAATNVVAGNGDSVLHLALSSHFSKEDDSLKVAKILVGAGCELQAQNSVGETALHAAAIGGYLPSMEYLISQGVPFNPNILLAHAKATWPNNKPTVMRWLISKGANVHAVAPNGDTALHLTLAYCFEATRLETARILVDSGCDPSQSNLAGETPLHVAARSGFPPLVKYLRSRNAPLPSDILLAATAALGEVELGQNRQHPRITPMFRLLIREGASLNVIAPNGDTLLHIATRQGLHLACLRKIHVLPQWELIAVLLSSGCDPFARNADGQTPFDLAEEKGYFFHSNFLRLVNTHYVFDENRPNLQMSSLKRRAEEMNRDMADRLTKRGRLDDIGDEDEIAEVDEQLMA